MRLNPDEGTYPTTADVTGTAPTTAADNSSVDGREAALWDGSGRYGMDGGVPRGRTDVDRERDLAKPWKFRPQGLAALQAATRKALGR